MNRKKYDVRISHTTRNDGKIDAIISFGNKIRAEFTAARIECRVTKNKIYFFKSQKGHKVTDKGEVKIAFPKMVDALIPHEGIYDSIELENGFYIALENSLPDYVSNPNLSRRGNHPLQPTKENGRKVSQRISMNKEVQNKMKKEPKIIPTSPQNAGTVKLIDAKNFKRLTDNLLKGYKILDIVKVTGLNVSAISSFLESVKNAKDNDEFFIYILELIWSNFVPSNVDSLADYYSCFEFKSLSQRKYIREQIARYRRDYGAGKEKTDDFLTANLLLDMYLDKQVEKAAASAMDSEGKSSETVSNKPLAKVSDLQDALEPSIMPNALPWIINKEFKDKVIELDKHSYIDLATFIEATTMLPHIEGNVIAKVVENFFTVTVEKIIKSEPTTLDEVKYLFQAMMAKMDDMSGRLDNLEAKRTLRLVRNVAKPVDVSKATKATTIPTSADDKTFDIKAWKAEANEMIKRLRDVMQSKTKELHYTTMTVFSYVYTEMGLTQEKMKELKKEYKKITGMNNPTTLDLVAHTKELRDSFKEAVKVLTEKAA